MTQNTPLQDAATDRSFFVQDQILEGETRFAEVADVRIWGYLTPVVSEVHVGLRRHPRRVYHPADLRMTAPDVSIRRIPDEPTTIRALTLGGDRLAEALGAPTRKLIDQFSRLQRFTFQSALISCVADQLSRPSGAAGDLAYSDALFHAVAHELRRIAGSQTPKLVSDRLSAAELRKLNAFIDAGLGRKLSLNDMAAVVSMPVAAFQVAMKKTIGLTAYQHLLQRRIASARRLLETTAQPLSEIAFVAGFASQSRMTDVFKAKLGVTPGALRRAAR
ncbi:MAG: helix-turn-helix transcriptional regulator [Pseudomonadota bacterium]